MTNNHTAAQPLDLDKLEALARDIESTGAWDFDTADTPFRIAGGEVVGGDALPYGDVYTMKEWETPDGSECLTIAQEVGTKFGKYIAAFDPPTVLALIAQARTAQPAGAADTTASESGEAVTHGNTDHVGRDLDGMPQPFAGAIVLLETIAECGALAFFPDGSRTPNSNLCKRFADELRLAGRATLPPVAAQQDRVEQVARAMAKHAGWDNWDTAQHVGHTLSGNEPEEERAHWCELAEIALSVAAQQEKK